ncbi:5-hydroxytryptamine receptor 2B-like [Megalops cyprinoides]|uniref:5-hydroxytryptamine receptor 2B-like n=1 Tax=Megalops cyprinoides TaxID=118141 RepID=UPI0018650A7F|nr:5-hydroxytryptamine receptor 2B-like [Megalops cyprinoides]
MLATPPQKPRAATPRTPAGLSNMPHLGQFSPLLGRQVLDTPTLAANASGQDNSSAALLALVAGGAGQGVVGEELRWASLLIITIIIPTIGGNVLVILAVSLERKLQNATNYFLMSLAVADLLVGLLVMPIALVTVLFNSGWPLPEFLCPIWLFLDVLFSTSSIMHLCAISLDRYIAIKKPIQHSQYKSRAKAMTKIAAVWLISIGIAISIPIKGLKNTRTRTFNNHHTCLLKPDCFKDFILFGSLAAFFVPLTIMMVIYLLTIQVLRKKVYLLKFKASQRFNSSAVSTVFQKERPSISSPEKAAMLDGPSRDRVMSQTNPIMGEEVPVRRMSTMGKKSMQNLSNEQRASKVLGIVFLLFVVMWCPFFITNVISAVCHTCDEHLVGRLMEIFVWVGYVSSGINPLVYTLFNKNFREAFSRYITCNFGGTRPPPRPPRRSLARMSFRSSVTENSKLFMKHGVRNGIGNVAYQSPLRLRPMPMQASTSILLDALLLAENEASKNEEQVSCV